MIVVVEGINGVGKTKFCERLHNKTGIPSYCENISIADMKVMYSSNGETIRSIMVEKMLTALEVLKETESDMIFDRFHLTEWVYGWIERNATIRSGISKVDDMLSDMGAKIVLFHPVDIAQINEKYKKDFTEYEKMFSKIKSKCDIINCTYLEMEAMVVKINEEHRDEMIRKWEG